MNNLISAGLPLGLSGVKIALHLLNFAILMAGMTLLLYKPVLKFIKKRQDDIAEQISENEKNNKTAQAMLEEYREKLGAAEAEIESRKAESDKAIAIQKEAILAEATARAEELYRQTEEECAAERTHAIGNLQNEVADVAVTIAGNILEREISAAEHEKIIDACIYEWSEND